MSHHPRNEHTKGSQLQKILLSWFWLSCDGWWLLGGDFDEILSSMRFNVSKSITSMGYSQQDPLKPIMQHLETNNRHFYIRLVRILPKIRFSNFIP